MLETRFSQKDLPTALEMPLKKTKGALEKRARERIFFFFLSINSEYQIG
jgi:hypothetical protein